MGGLGYFKCFKFSKTVTSLQRSAKINPPTHTTTGKEKNGPCLHNPLARFLTSTWDKVEKYVLCSHYVACFHMCFMLFFPPRICMCVVYQASSAHCVWIWYVFVCFHVMWVLIHWKTTCNSLAICFLHFLLPSLLLFSVSSPTVSLPTRPASLDLSHEEATFWLRWCVLKNPYLNSSDSPA